MTTRPDDQTSMKETEYSKINMNSKSIQDEAFIFRGRRFRKTTYNGISIIQDIESGYYNVGKMCRDNGKKLHNWFQIDGVSDLLNMAGNELDLDIDFPEVQNWTPGKYIGFKVKSGGKIDISNLIQGTYLHPELVHFPAEYCNLQYAWKVKSIMNAINEENNSKLNALVHSLQTENRNLRGRISHVLTENTKLKQENSQLEDEVLVQTLDKEFISYDNSKLQLQVHDLTTPKNKLIPTYLYAKKYGDYFHLKYKQINPHLIKGNIKQLSMINAKDVKIDFMYYGKKLNLLENIGGKWLCRMSDIDLIFEILDKLKDNTFDLNEYQDTNVLIHEELTKLKALPKTPQRNGKIFELEYCSNRNLTPWEFIPSSVLNRYHEIHLDTGIDFVQISNGNINGIGQVKVKAGSYLNRSDIETFTSKCQDKNFQSMKKSIILKNTKIGKKLKAYLNELGVDIIMI